MHLPQYSEMSFLLPAGQIDEKETQKLKEQHSSLYVSEEKLWPMILLVAKAVLFTVFALHWASSMEIFSCR